MNLSDNLTNREWRNILSNDFNEKYFKELSKHIQERKRVLCPRPENIFKALNLTSYNNVRVVIVSQEPYNTIGVADGLAFSSKDATPTIKNLFKELKSDLGVHNTISDLTSYANQGVLLLNHILTTETGKKLKHVDIGWQQFTEKVLSSLDNREKPVVFIFLGKKVEQLQLLIKSKHHLVIVEPHPSIKSFSGSKIFSKSNNFLIKSGIKPINWEIIPKEKQNNGIF